MGDWRDPGGSGREVRTTQTKRPQVSDFEGVSEHNLSAERAPYGMSRTYSQGAWALCPKMLICLEGAHALCVSSFGGVGRHGSTGA